MAREFGKSLTIEQFKAEKKCNKLFFNYATKKNAMGIQEPLMYNDENGKPTDVQKIAVTNEAGETVAWASREIAAEIAAGKPIFADPRGIAVTENIDTETGSVSMTFHHPRQNNRIEGLSC